MSSTGKRLLPTYESDEPSSGAVKSVNVTFYSNEPAYYMGSGAELKLNEENGNYEYSVNLTKNGTYRYSFVDKAGNITDVPYTASKIDNTAPVITVTGIPETKAQVQAWNSDPANAGNQKNTYLHKSAHNLQVSADEAGTLTFCGETIDIRQVFRNFIGELQRILWNKRQRCSWKHSLCKLPHRSHRYRAANRDL